MSPHQLKNFKAFFNDMHVHVSVGGYMHVSVVSMKGPLGADVGLLEE